jgi:hypothetical protein
MSPTCTRQAQEYPPRRRSALRRAGNVEVVVVLGMPPINSARDAVRPSIVAKHRNLVEWGRPVGRCMCLQGML